VCVCCVQLGVHIDHLDSNNRLSKNRNEKKIRIGTLSGSFRLYKNNSYSPRIRIEFLTANLNIIKLFGWGFLEIKP